MIMAQQLALVLFKEIIANNYKNRHIAPDHLLSKEVNALAGRYLMKYPSFSAITL